MEKKLGKIILLGLAIVVLTGCDTIQASNKTDEYQPILFAAWYSDENNTYIEEILNIDYIIENTSMIYIDIKDGKVEYFALIKGGKLAQINKYYFDYICKKWGAPLVDVSKVEKDVEFKIHFNENTFFGNTYYKINYTIFDGKNHYFEVEEQMKYYNIILK